MADGLPHIETDGLRLTTVGLDQVAVETARQVISQEAVKFFTALPDYLPGPANGLLAHAPDATGALVYLIDFDGSRDLAAQTAITLQTLANGRAMMIALSVDEHPDLILNAMRAGCTEYLHKPLQASELASCLQKLRRRWLATRPGSAPAGGRMLGFLGVRGGAGTTTIAVHLGTFLARRQSQKTLLIDSHLQLGHVGVLLGMDSHGYHFLDLVGNIARLDRSLVNSYVAHHPSGLDLLPSPDALQAPRPIAGDALERALGFVAELYDFILLDCPHGMEELNQVVVRCCDEVYLVATPELPALRDLSRYLGRLAELQVPAEKLKVIINRQEPHRTLSVEQIEQAIGHPVTLVLPCNTADLVRTVDTGEPISPDKKSEFANQIRKWACALAPAAPPTTEVKRRFAFWS